MPSREIQDLHPVVRRKYLSLATAAEARGIPFIVTQTGRTHEEQIAFHAQGRLTLEEVNNLRKFAGLPAIKAEQNRIITWVTTSVHEFGLGFDVALKKEGGKVHWDTKVDINQDGSADYTELGLLGEELGLTWGGRFKGRDLVHFEWTGGLTLHELRTGKRPPDAIEPTEKKTDKPKKQEAKMNPALMSNLLMIGKTLLFKDVTEDVQAQGKDQKPWYQSRRYLHSAVGTGIALAGATGLSIPPDQAAILIDSGLQIVDVVKENKGLWAAIPTAAGAIWGSIRAGKPAKKKKRKG